MEQKIIYQNRSFCLGSKKRYYFARVRGRHVSLHRYKYEQEKGPIPPGWHVHHKDGNCLNNDINNLEVIAPKKHAHLHRDIFSENGKKNISKAIKAAPVWHTSEEGHQWHKAHYDNIKDKLHSTVNRLCNSCGKEVTTTRKTGNAFCSNACKSMWRRKNKPDKKTAICPTCKSEFETLKYLPNTYCSKKCKPAPNPEGARARYKR